MWTETHINLSTAIPGAVMGWMAAWGVWEPDRRSVTLSTSSVWLPSASGTALHEVVAGTFDRLGHTARARCRNRGEHVALLTREATSPGDLLERNDVRLSSRSLPIWQRVAVALRVYAHLRYTEPHRYAAVDWAIDYVSSVARNDAFADRLVDLGPRWQTMPEEGRALLPWLIVAAANGIDRCCVRCSS
jgi:hypothetical protein